VAAPPPTRDKVYSLHAPEVECIGKGESHRPYEFGVEVSVATPVKHSGGGQFVAHVAARYRSEPVSCYFVCSMPRDGMNVCSPS
jgi:hypothetical protein